ncbi:MAG: hypothetical protein C4339_03985 [Nitrososphaerota archaeon]
MTLSATQDRMPEVKEVLDRVGVKGIALPLRVDLGGLSQCVLWEASLFIDLDGDKKGVHMSRLTESLYEAAEQAYRSLPEFGILALRLLQRRHRYRQGRVLLRGSVLLRRSTPSTHRSSFEPYDVTCEVLLRDGKPLCSLAVKVVGSTLCPHSLESTGGMAHSQRASVYLKVTSSDALPKLEELVEIAEEALSAPSLTLLKASDEVQLVKRMYQRPMFVEDVARECLKLARQRGLKGRLRVIVEALESIHKHNAWAEIVRELGDGHD